jgi:Secretion system C-terminal sorting domain
MKYIFCVLILLGLNIIPRAQPILQDTLLSQFDQINFIVPFEDQTFLLAGKKGAAHLLMTNVQLDTIWSLSFSDFTDTRIWRCEINYEDGDTTIHLLVFPFDCDFFHAGIARLFTIEMDGTIRDTMFIPYENNLDFIELLAGNPDWPRYAIFREMNFDTQYVDLFYSDGRIERLLFTFFPIRSVDIFPSGHLLLNRWYVPKYFIYHQVNEKYELLRTGLSTYSTMAEVKCASNGHVFYCDPNAIELFDSLGTEVGSYPMFDMSFDLVSWKTPYLYIKGWSGTDLSDSFFVFDINMDLVYKEPISFDYQYQTDIAILGDRLYRVGLDQFLKGGHIESEDLVTHEGPKYYDVGLINFKVDPHDTAFFLVNCGSFFRYQIPKAYITIQNHCEFPVSQLEVIYDNSILCCENLSWNRTLDHMDLMPGDTRTYALDNIELLRRFPFHDGQKDCIWIIHPDQHADDDSGNNFLCLDLELGHFPGMQEEEEVRHYPDPVHDELRFISSSVLEFDITIYDLQGKKVLMETAMSSNDMAIDISHFSQGIYFMQYRFANSGRIKVVKFVKA